MDEENKIGRERERERERENGGEERQILSRHTFVCRPLSVVERWTREKRQRAKETYIM